jgi:hypothetical protein
MLTEFGGIAFSAKKRKSTKDWGYSKVASAADFSQRYQKLLRVVTHASLLSGFCYTQFADTFQEANGLLNADRTPKIPLAAIRKATRIVRNYTPD